MRDMLLYCQPFRTCKDDTVTSSSRTDPRGSFSGEGPRTQAFSTHKHLKNVKANAFLSMYSCLFIRTVLSIRRYVLFIFQCISLAVRSVSKMKRATYIMLSSCCELRPRRYPGGQREFTSPGYGLHWMLRYWQCYRMANQIGL